MSDPDVSPEGDVMRVIDETLLRLGQLKEVKLPPARITRLLLVFVANDRSVFLKPKVPVDYNYDEEFGDARQELAASGFVLGQVAAMLCDYYGLSYHDLSVYFKENY